MARLIIKLTQSDEVKRVQLREVYGNDAMMLIAVGQTVATEFAMIAAANNKRAEVIWLEGEILCRLKISRLCSLEQVLGWD